MTDTLLLHFDGADNSTTFTDSGEIGKHLIVSIKLVYIFGFFCNKTFDMAFFGIFRHFLAFFSVMGEREARRGANGFVLDGNAGTTGSGAFAEFDSVIVVAGGRVDISSIALSVV